MAVKGFMHIRAAYLRSLIKKIGASADSYIAFRSDAPTRKRGKVARHLKLGQATVPRERRIP